MGHEMANSSTCTLYSVSEKTYTLIGTGTMKTNWTATFVYAFASTGTYKVRVHDRRGVRRTIGLHSIVVNYM
jgi:hypothetical protein